MKKYFDKNKQEVMEFDLIRFFHFIGARRKKYYMYKQVRRGMDGKLYLLHLNKNNKKVLLDACVSKIDDDTYVLQDEGIIIQNG